MAFANSAGGKLIVGVNDDKSIHGIADPLEQEERITSLISDSITPKVVPNIEIATVSGKSILLVEVFLSSGRPHYLNAEGPENGVFVRLGSSSRQADRHLIEELRRSVSGEDFDEMPMPELSKNQLDLDEANEFFDGIRKLTPKALLTLKWLKEHQGKTVPTKGGLLLFGKDKEQFFPDAWIQCGRFMGTTKSEIFDHYHIHASLPRCVDEVMNFLKKHAFRGADLSQIRRKDVWSIPLTILREIVINALVHSDYSQRGAPIRVAFFDDRIEVENPGILLPGMTIEDLRQGVSKIRNPVIARTFMELSLVEQWGSGVPRVFEESEKLGLPTPKIEEIGMRVRVTIYLGEEHQKALQTSDADPGEQVTGQVTGQVAGQVKKLLEICRGEMSKKELMQALDLKGRDSFEKLYLKPALEQSVIEMTIPDKPNSRMQKYRLMGKNI